MNESVVFELVLMCFAESKLQLMLLYGHAFSPEQAQLGMTWFAFLQNGILDFFQRS